MDTFIFSDGRSFLSDLETRLAKKEGQNGWHVLSGTIGIEFYLVTNFLWTTSAFIGTYRNCGNVDIDCDDNKKVLPLIKAGVLSAGAISVVG